jgi:hypothetical protein
VAIVCIAVFAFTAVAAMPMLARSTRDYSTLGSTAAGRPPSLKPPLPTAPAMRFAIRAPPFCNQITVSEAPAACRGKETIFS